MKVSRNRLLDSLAMVSQHTQGEHQNKSRRHFSLPLIDPFNNFRVRFLNLPPEIRRRIYELLLKTPSVIIHRGMINLDVSWPFGSWGSWIEYLDERDLDCNILLTCKQLYHEGSQYMYGSNQIHIDIHPSKRPIVPNLPCSAAQFLKSLRISITFQETSIDYEKHAASMVMWLVCSRAKLSTFDVGLFAPPWTKGRKYTIQWDGPLLKAVRHLFVDGRISIVASGSVQVAQEARERLQNLMSCSVDVHGMEDE